MSDSSPGERLAVLPSAGAVFWLSAAVIALELALMRCLSIARWHHFSYLVISTALLGFGASGTLLTFIGDRLRRRFSAWAVALTLLFAVSATAAYRAAERLPLDVRYVFYSSRQAALMLAHDFLLFVPFFLAATVIGLSLMHFRGRVHLIYGANLLGSGAGAALAVGLMFLIPPDRLLYAVAGLGVLSALLWASAAGRWRAVSAAAALVLAGALGAEATLAPVRIEVDQYKDLAILRRWEDQGSADHMLTDYGARARIDVYASDLLHKTMFAGLTATEAPPPQLALLADGHYAATVLQINSPREARILDHTPMSVAYRLVDRPHVLLLGESGGTNVWLARRMGAEHITVVQPNPRLLELMQGPLADSSGRVFSGPDVTTVSSGLRAFLERTRKRFDIIQIVSTETPAAGASGLRSLHEDFLLTEEGLGLCIRRLAPRGALSVTRGIQAPPRDNVKLFATLRAALQRAGARRPGRRLVQVRNLLAANTLAFARPLGEDRCSRLLSAARNLAADVEWAPCSGVDYADQTNRVAGPEGVDYSYFHHAARRLLSGERDEFLRGWAYTVRPPTDESPYFYNFFRWRSLPRFWESYGKRWLTRLELGYVVLVVALLQVIVVGGALILLPLLRLRKARGVSGGRLATLTYFALLGLAFMFLEMVCLLKFTYYLGDPIYSAAVMLSGFLVFSGLGSILSRRVAGTPRRAIRLAAAGIAAFAVFYAVGLDGLFRLTIGLPLSARVVVALGTVAPAAFLMGWPFPSGLTVLEGGRPALAPWAWGANGFASVAASPLTVILSIHAGYPAVLLGAAALYVAAAAVSLWLPGPGGAPE